jgi:hypothetical protein
MADVRDDLRCWADLREAARALDAVVDSLLTEESDEARRLLVEVDKLRAKVEVRVLAPFGIQPRPPYTGN